MLVDYKSPEWIVLACNFVMLQFCCVAMMADYKTPERMTFLACNNVMLLYCYVVMMQCWLIINSRAHDLFGLKCRYVVMLQCCNVG